MRLGGGWDGVSGDKLSEYAYLYSVYPRSKAWKWSRYRYRGKGKRKGKGIWIRWGKRRVCLVGCCLEVLDIWGMSGRMMGWIFEWGGE